MKTINNIGFLTVNGIEEKITLCPERREIIVPANQSVMLSLLVFQEDIHVCVRLTGKEARCDIKVVYLSHEFNKQNIDIEVIHESQKTVSAQAIRGIVSDSAYTSFHGVIRVPSNAGECIGTQNHRAVLLSEKARVTAVPELEIFAEDVQCSHGSSIGMLDETELFYMMSRGISESSARQLLLTAMIRDILPPVFDMYIQDWMSAHV